MRRRRVFAAAGGGTVLLAAAAAYMFWPASAAPPAEVLGGVACPVPLASTPDGSLGEPMITPGSIPSSFRPVAVVSCPAIMVQGHDPTDEMTRYEGDLGPVEAALSERDDRRPGTPCSTEFSTSPYLWLVDASGRAVLVHRPVDACGHPKPDVDVALRSLAASRGS